MTQLAPRTKRLSPQEAQGRKANRLVFGVLASANRFAEDIRVHPVVIAELKLSDIQRQLFPADILIGADNAAKGNSQAVKRTRAGLEATKRILFRL